MPKTTIVATAVCAALSLTPFSVAQAPAKPPAKAPAARAPAKPAGKQSGLSASVEAKSASILAALESAPPDPAKARAEAAALLCWVAAYADPEADAAAFRAAAITDRLVTQLAQAPADKVPALAKLLRACPTFSARLCFLIDPRDKRAPSALAIAERLAKEMGADGTAQVEAFAELAAAVCIVHSRPFERRVNENTMKAPDPVAIFKYFVSNERALAFGLKSVPADLLAHVVDVSAPIEQLNWARSEFGSGQNLGRLYAMVQYDYEHILSNKKKKVTENGFTLQNIRRFGGVCADQAYFTSEVAKALGVPSAYVVGRDTTVSHAWVGLFEAKGKNAGWDFDTGRYPDYQQVRGNIMDPITGIWVPDGKLDILADSFTLPPARREESRGLVDAAECLLLAAGDKRRAPYPPPPGWLGEASVSTTPAREATPKAALELIRHAVERSPSTLYSWETIARMSREGRLSLDDKREWAGALERLCGKKYPDFTWQILRPMVTSIEESAQQENLWERFVLLFKARPDLASAVRLSQGTEWEMRKSPAKAWDAYQDIVNRYANESPFVPEALKACQELLEARNKPAEVLSMYERAWKKMRQPQTTMSHEFRRQSNWFRVGAAYAAALAAAGRDAEAEQVRNQLRLR